MQKRQAGDRWGLTNEMTPLEVVRSIRRPTAFCDCLYESKATFEKT